MVGQLKWILLCKITWGLQDKKIKSSNTFLLGKGNIKCKMMMTLYRVTKYVIKHKKKSPILTKFCDTSNVFI